MPAKDAKKGAVQPKRSVQPREAFGSVSQPHRKHGTIKHSPSKLSARGLPQQQVQRVQRWATRFPNKIAKG